MRPRRGPVRRARRGLVALALVTVLLGAIAQGTSDVAGRGLGTRSGHDPSESPRPVRSLTAPTRGFASAVTGTEDAVLAEVAVDGVGGEPLTYDPGTGELYTADPNHANVTVLDPETDSVVANVSVGDGPGGVVLDGATGDLWVASYFAGTVSEIDPSTDGILATADIPQPLTPTLDPRNGELYVVSQTAAGWNLTAVNGTTAAVGPSVPVASSATSDVPTPVFDPANGQLFLALDGGATDSLIAVDPANLTVAATVVGTAPMFRPLFDPADDRLYVSSAGPNLTVVSGANDTVVGTIPTGDGTGSPGLDPANDSILVPQCCHGAAGAGTITMLNGSTGAFEAAADAPSYPTTPTYDAANGEVYVAANANELLAIDAENWSDIVAVPLPSPAGSVTVGPATAGAFAPLPADGRVAVVDDQPLAIPSFHASERPPASGSVLNVTVGVAGGVGPLAFAYIGLPRGCAAADLPWIQCVPRQSGAFDLAVTVTDAFGASAFANTSVQVLAGPSVYPVTFTETGLSPGTDWTVSFGSSWNSSRGGSIAFQSVNRTGVEWEVLPESLQQSATPPNGTVDVDGRAVEVAVHFSNASAQTGAGTDRTALEEEYGLVAAVVAVAAVTGAL